MFNLSFSSYFNDCLTCWADYWGANVCCDMTVLWIYIVSGCSNCFTFFTLSTLIWCTEVFFNIFNVFHFWFNRCFYYFVLGCNFNDCIRWFFRTNWFSYTWGNFPCCWIYFVRCCDSIFTIFTFNGDCFSTFFFRIIFFVTY